VYVLTFSMLFPLAKIGLVSLLFSLNTLVLSVSENEHAER
jgi:uncharacterized protein (UPF0212 family)